MKSSWFIILIVTTYTWAAQAQTRLQELKKNRAYYQKKVAEANTKPNGLHLRAVNEEIVSYVVNKGYETRVDATTPSHLVVRDPHQPSKVLMQLKGGDEVIVYERQGKNAFLVRTENDVVGLVHKGAFGSQLNQFPLEVLVQSFSPEEQAARERQGVVEQRMVNEPLKLD